MAQANALIVMPTYNEADNIEPLLHSIMTDYSGLDVLVVDDNSPDGTGAIADRLTTIYPAVHVLHRAGKMGLGPAYIVGFQWGLAQGYSYLLEMDCDFSHHPRYLPSFLESIQQADVVIGSRYVPGGDTPDWGFVRRFISAAGNLFARTALQLRTRDCTSGFRCYRREVLADLPWGEMSAKGYAFQIGLVYLIERKGHKVIELPISFEDRRVGVSKMSPDIVVEAFCFVTRLAFTGGRQRREIKRGRIAAHD